MGAFVGADVLLLGELVAPGAVGVDVVLLGDDVALLGESVADAQLYVVKRRQSISALASFSAGHWSGAQ